MCEYSFLFSFLVLVIILLILLIKSYLLKIEGQVPFLYAGFYYTFILMCLDLLL